ncbi:hypothetical protein [Levilactobacillus brevis]|nr:hypothetical protein [Levilactobacillus brevis]KIP00426.1 ATPase component of general energizing module of ECF transporter [Levilactobacillus brevis]
MTENIISVDHLTYQYDENQAPALTDVSFTVLRWRVVGNCRP